MNCPTSKNKLTITEAQNIANPIFSISHAGDFEVCLYNSIHAVAAEAWDACLENNNLFLSRKYLAVAESSELPGLQVYYAVIKKKHRARAILYFQMVNLSDEGLGGVLNLEEYGGLASGLSSRINDLLFSPDGNKKSYLLVCGNLLVSGDHGIRAVDEESYGIAVEAISPVKKHLESGLGKHCKLVAFMVKDFYESDNSVVSPILKKDYFLLNTDPEMIFEVDSRWKTFNDYLSVLASKYRIRANQVRSRIEKLEIRNLSAEEIKERESEIYNLNTQVMRKAPVKLVKPSSTYFIKLKEAFGNQYNIKGFFKDGHLVAFTSALFNGTHFEAHYIGIDYKYNKEYALYQNILYCYINDAISFGSSRVYFGRTALEIKSTTGAKPHFLACYFRFANRLINTLARPLVSSTGPGDWIPRDPFKSTL